MVTKVVTLSLFMICFVQASESGEPEVLPIPSAASIGEASIMMPHPAPMPHYNSDTGRRLSGKLEVASAVVRGHFRRRIGRGHAATWLADSVRRKADQLQDGFIDGAPRELLVRNMLQIHADVDELLSHVAVANLQYVQRNVPEHLHKIECLRNELAAMLGIELVPLAQ